MRQMRISLLVIGIGLIGIIGCGADGSGNVVVGKVTLGGNAVEGGTITFSGKDNKKVMAPIDKDGSYKIVDVAAGPNQVSIQANIPGGKNGSIKGNLTFDVKPGKNSHDFPLEK
jgi:hypothetical protein